MTNELSERVAAAKVWPTGHINLITDLDAERLRLTERFEKACGELTARETRIMEQSDEIESLRTKLREAEVDAGRYRWLRDESYREPNAPGPIYRSLYDGIKGRADTLDLRRVWLRYGNALDAAIDAAIAAAKEGK